MQSRPSKRIIWIEINPFDSGLFRMCSVRICLFRFEFIRFGSDSGPVIFLFFILRVDTILAKLISLRFSSVRIYRLDHLVQVQFYRVIQRKEMEGKRKFMHLLHLKN